MYHYKRNLGWAPSNSFHLTHARSERLTFKQYHRSRSELLDRSEITYIACLALANPPLSMSLNIPGHHIGSEKLYIRMLHLPAIFQSVSQYTNDAQWLPSMNSILSLYSRELTVLELLKVVLGQMLIVVKVTSAHVHHQHAAPGPVLFLLKRRAAALQ